MIRNLFLLVMTMFTLNAFAQTIVSTETMKKKVVLEEFTGIHCGYCPDGHKVAKELMLKYPGQFYTVAIHAGGFAAPSAGEPDYRTDFGEAIDNYCDVQGYPAGAINRVKFPGAAEIALGRGDWGVKAPIILGEDAPVNIGIETFYTEETRELTVKVEVFYTADAAEANNFIQLAVTQNHIIGPQASGGDAYEHMHMLRHFITGQWGDEILTTTKDSFIEKEYTWVLPENINDVPLVAENCKIVAYVTEDKGNATNVAEAKLVNGKSIDALLLSNLGAAGDIGAIGTPTFFNFEVNSLIEGTSDFELSSEGMEMPADWTSVLVIDGTEFSEPTIVSITKETPLEVQLKVIPGSKALPVDFYIKGKSIAEPKAEDKKSKAFVLAGYDTFLMSGVSNTTALTELPVYEAALSQEGMDEYCKIDVNHFDLLKGSENFNLMKRIYFNVSLCWGFMNEEQIIGLTAFLDNGGQLFISGQDIGWDIYDAQGSCQQDGFKNFYTNYLATKYKADGGTANNEYNAFSDSGIYDDVPKASLKAIFGSDNFYPDELEAIGEGRKTFYYSSEAKVGGVANNNETFKVSYLGINFMAIDSESVRNQIMMITFKYFEGLVSVDEYANQMQEILKASPNPASNNVCISGLSLEGQQALKLYNNQGQLIKVVDCQVEDGSTQFFVGDLTSGIYHIQLENGQKLKVVKE